MIIGRKSPISGIYREYNLNITEKQYSDWEHGNISIQNAFPNLSPDEREFILTGISPDEWDEIFQDQ